MNVHSPTASGHSPKPVVPYTEEPTPEQRKRAVRVVASSAQNAQDCADLLEALGLSPEEGRGIPTQRNQ